MSARDEVINWLRDAYAMERGLEVVLKKTSARDIYPNVIRFAAGKHLEETRRHADMVESLLKSLGEDTPALKTGTSIVAHAAAGLGAMMTHDELINDLLVSYAMEQYEIVFYRSLVAAAQIAGLSKVAGACREMIANEDQMAAIIHQALPELVETYLGEQKTAKAA